MDIIELASANHDRVFYVLAGICFILELGLLGLSGPLLFFAIACLVTAFLISAGLISGWEMEILVAGTLTVVITSLLWKPLKKFQNSRDGADTSSDMIGRLVTASEVITSEGGTIRYSGIDWPARLDASASEAFIAEGKQCMIASVDGNIMLVRG
jgi:membrane protein implicated in regulation of membrane protease activity